MKTQNYKEKNEVQILILFQEVFKQKITTEFWEWRFKNNVLNEILIKLMWDETKLIGHYGACPVEFLINDVVHKAALSLTTMTHSNYGGQNIFPSLAADLYKYMIENHYQLIYGFPNSNSHYSFVKKLEWENLFEIPTFNLKLENLAPQSNNALRFSQSDNFKFTEQHYKLFTAYTKMYNVKLNRTAFFLNWRFCQNPSNQYHIIELFENEEIIAFAVCKLYNNKEVDIVELIYPSDYSKLLDLFQNIKQNFTDATDINCWLPLNDEKHILMEKIGFSNQAPITYMGYRNLGEDLGANNWYYSMSDSDIY